VAVAHLVLVSRMKSLVVVAILLVLPIGRAADQPNQFVVLSYCMGEDHYRFSLMSSADFDAILGRESNHRREVIGAGYLPDVSALKHNISDLVPEGSVIEWRGWKRAWGTCYPPQPIIDEIRTFAASRHIDVRIRKADEAEIKLRAQKMVDRYATLAETEAEFGRPEFMFTRDQALEYLQKTPAENKSGHDNWQRLAQYPKTLCFDFGEFSLDVFLDDRGGAVGYYLRSQ